MNMLMRGKRLTVSDLSMGVDNPTGLLWGQRLNWVLIPLGHGIGDTKPLKFGDGRGQWSFGEDSVCSQLIRLGFTFDAKNF